jgi:TolA-binding protein
MTVVGLHPEELFDKLLDGELLPSDAERLRQHLSTCSVCRFEHAARLDFQAEALALAGPPPALPLRPLPLVGFVAEAPVPAASPRRRRSRRLIWGMAAAALISASGAVAAGIVQGKAPWHGLGTLFSESPAGLPPAFSPPKKPKSVLAAPARAAESSAPTTSSPLALEATPPAASPQHAARARPHSAPKLSHSAASSIAPATLETAQAPADKAPAKEPTSAAKLFGEANQARRSGDIGRASGLYHLLQDQYPGSPEAELSRVTLSLLLLDNGDAHAALVGFERYLAGSSRGLEAEALVGRARALGRLGRRDLEAAAWREVQRKYPTSIYGRQATERLSALGQP